MLHVHHFCNVLTKNKKPFTFCTTALPISAPVSSYVILATEISKHKSWNTIMNSLPRSMRNNVPLSAEGKYSIVWVLIQKNITSKLNVISFIVCLVPLEYKFHRIRELGSLVLGWRQLKIFLLWTRKLTLVYTVITTSSCSFIAFPCLWKHSMPTINKIRLVFLLNLNQRGSKIQ